MNQTLTAAIRLMEAFLDDAKWVYCIALNCYDSYGEPLRFNLKCVSSSQNVNIFHAFRSTALAKTMLLIIK